MKHPRVIPLIGRISGLLPVLAAVTLGWSSVSASADAVSDLNDIFQTTDKTDPNYPGYAFEEGVTVTHPAAYGANGTPNIVTAPATDLVYAVYRLAQTSTYNSSPTALSNLVDSALGGIQTVSTTDNTPKYLRADLNVIAPRVLNAALLGSGFTGANAESVIENLVNLNSAFQINGKPNARVQLTVAGKQAVIAQGLKSLGADTTDAKKLGQFAATTFTALAPSTATQATRDLYVQLYTGGLLKLVGTGTGAVTGFTQGILSGVSSDHTAYALKVAEYAALNPAAAGAVIGGRAVDLGGSATTNDYTTLLRMAFSDPKLAAAKVSAFASVATVEGGDPTGLGSNMFNTTASATGTPLAVTTANKAIVMAGVIQGLAAINGTAPSHTTVQNVFNNIGFVGNTSLKSTEYAAFAATAALGSGDAAGSVARVLLDGQYGAETTKATGTADIANRVAIGVAVLKAIATTSPSSGAAVAVQVIASGNGGSGSSTSVFNNDTALTTLGKSLAGGIKATNGALIGSTVEGVASQLGGQSDSQLADFVTAVVPFAPTGALNITQAITTSLILPGGSGASNNFATALAGKIPLAYALNAMAGIAAADPTNSGSIAAAVTTSTALSPYAASFATSIATAVPEERVVDVAQALANTYRATATTAGKTPLVSTLPTLAANVAKVIQTKPLTETKFRTVELSELAATLVNVAVQKIPAGTTDANTFKAMEPTVAAIGNAVIAALSPKLLQNDAGLAADQQDAVKQIAGAVAQAIAANPTLPASIKHLLLDQVADTRHPGGTLPGLLETALLARTAVAYKNDVATAFADVLVALNDPNNPTHIVAGSYTAGANGAYASGNLFEVETPIVNVL